MDLKNYIDSIFSAYEETDELADFKEELQSNLYDRVRSLEKKGLDSPAAFEKAVSEWGDISALADEISLRKKQEVFENAYMGVRNYLTPKRALIYILGGVSFCCGLLFSVITWLTTELETAALGSAVLFCVGSTAIFTFMGLTQETASRYAMPVKRAMLYTLSASVFVFGAFAAPLTYFAVSVERISPEELAAHGALIAPSNFSLMSAVATMLPFIIPSVALFVFLLLTEKDRSKPWVKDFRKKTAEYEMERFAVLTQNGRFGLISGAIWIGAVSGFILLTIYAGIHISWLVIVAAIISEMLVLASFQKS